jgi:hypothetical protein
MLERVEWMLIFIVVLDDEAFGYLKSCVSDIFVPGQTVS